MVRAAGLEPARHKGLRILSPVCLPVPPRPHQKTYEAIARNLQQKWREHLRWFGTSIID